MFFSNINYIAVIAAAVAGMVIGFIWHADFAFGKLWRKSKGWTDETFKHKMHGRSMFAVNAAYFISSLAMAFVLASLFNSLVVLGLGGVLLAAFLLWVGLMMPAKFSDYLFAGESLSSLVLTAAYWLVQAAVMSLIIAFLS